MSATFGSVDEIVRWDGVDGTDDDEGGDGVVAGRRFSTFLRLGWGRVLLISFNAAAVGKLGSLFCFLFFLNQAIHLS